MRPACHCDETFVAAFTNLNPTPVEFTLRGGLRLPGSLPHNPEEHTHQRRGIDNSCNRHTAFDQSYIDGELPIPIDEFLSSIKRIDQKECFRCLRQYIGSSLLLRDNRYGWNEVRKQRQNFDLSCFIGGSDGRCIDFGPHLHVRLMIYSHDGFTCR